MKWNEAEELTDSKVGTGRRLTCIVHSVD
jgi:hypothetical protein